MRALMLAATICFGGFFVGSAQAQTLTVVPKKDPVQGGVPAGQVSVFADGTYTVVGNQVVDKVIVKWYRQEANGNLTWVADSTDGVPAVGIYSTNKWNADINNAQGAPNKWTCIAHLYVTRPGNPVPVIVRSAVVVNFLP